MTTKSGYCFAPEGAVVKHGDCHGCTCACHGESAGIASVARGNGAEVRDNVSPTKDGPGDSLLAQRAEVPGPRPTLDRSAEL